MAAAVTIRSESTETEAMLTTDTKRAAGGTTDRPFVGIGTKTRIGIARGAKIVIGTIPVVIARRETGAGAAVGAAVRAGHVRQRAPRVDDDLERLGGRPE